MQRFILDRYDLGGALLREALPVTTEVAVCSIVGQDLSGLTYTLKKEQFRIPSMTAEQPRSSKS